MPCSRPDLLVVGAGPVGLTTALLAARAGLAVTVVDRRAGVQDKACGEGLMPGALAALRELGVDPPGHDFHGITYRRDAPTERQVHARFRHGPGRGVRRTALSAALHDAAMRAGVDVVQATVDEVDQRTDHVRAAGLTARYLVAADGLHSPVRRAVGAAREPARRGPARYCLRRHYRIRPWTSSVEVTWADGSEAYATPVAGDVVGVAVLASARGGFDQQLSAFPVLRERLTGAETVSADRGAGPLRQDVVRRVVGRVLLVGDAAGYVDALTGEGLAVGFATAQELVRCVVAGRPEAYEAAWRRASWTPRLLTAGLLRARRTPGVGARIVPLAAAMPPVFGAVVGRLAG